MLRSTGTVLFIYLSLIHSDTIVLLDSEACRVQWQNPAKSQHFEQPGRSSPNRHVVQRLVYLYLWSTITQPFSFSDPGLLHNFDDAGQWHT
ncbi:hypothetical protein C8R44DRAFT_817797 [Mycena epipterygia]|nr:hypothetical protein C8R44DRAFT_817797 [Mycena epipterygia]